MGLLAMHDIDKHYDNIQVLDKVNLQIEEGEFFTFLGPSGCGKTTLLRIIAGFVQPDQGQVFFNEKEITYREAEKRNIGMVFQNYALFPFMTVFENVAYGLRMQKEKKGTIAKKVQEVLQLVNLEGYEERSVSELSGGEQQRVALARSLVMEPKLLLLDEPLSNLDARLRDRMRMELKAIQGKLGITTIFVTHDQTEALSMSDRIAVFERGRCVQVGSPYEIYHDPVNAFVADFIGDTNMFKARIQGKKAEIRGSLAFNLDRELEGDYVSIRPQDISMTRCGILENDRDGNYYEGILEKRTISGHLIEYEIRVDNHMFKIIQLNENTSKNLYQLGKKVELFIDPKNIKVLKS